MDCQHLLILLKNLNQNNFFFQAIPSTSSLPFQISHSTVWVPFSRTEILVNTNTFVKYHRGFIWHSWALHIFTNNTLAVIKPDLCAVRLQKNPHPMPFYSQISNCFPLWLHGSIWKMMLMSSTEKLKDLRRLKIELFVFFPQISGS